MERIQRTTRPFSSGAIVAVLAAVVTGCGDDTSYKNDLRPPSPINVTAFISQRAVSVSPTSFGGGPIAVIVANQSATSQKATLETATSGGAEPDFAQDSGLINPGGTGTIKVDVPPGTYQLRVGEKTLAGDSPIRPATIKVGAKRASAQNDVLQP
ncbi:MAG: hypothetical protein ACR2NH_09560 [Solirubrobacteraceae bacterium]